MRTLETEKVAKDRRLSVGIRFFVAILMHFALGILGERGALHPRRALAAARRLVPPMQRIVLQRRAEARS